MLPWQYYLSIWRSGLDHQEIMISDQQQSLTGPMPVIKLKSFHTFYFRDLKPTNVLLDDDDQPLLMDLGSMNQARIVVQSSREALRVQVRGRPGETEVEE